MIKRLIIVLIVAAGVVFVPYWLGHIKLDWLINLDGQPKWLLGILYIGIAFCCAGVLGFFVLIIINVIDYIKHGK